MTAVCITTYNHAAFISQAVESVLMQKCDEPLTIYIGDDASTDQTAEICERLAKEDKRIRYYRRQTNVGLVENTILLYEQIIADGCEFVAMLDGDDYWTDSRKLHTQIDYLRAHPEVGLVHTGALIELDGLLMPQDETNILSGDLSRCYNLRGAGQTNCTVLFRTALLRTDEMQALREQRFPVLDYPLYGLFSQRTQFAFLPTPTAVWRSHNSVSRPLSRHDTLRYHRERIRMWHWLEKCYPGQFNYCRTKALAWYLWKVFYTMLSSYKRQICKKKKQ